MLGSRKGLDLFFHIIYRSMYAFLFSGTRDLSFKSSPSKRVGPGSSANRRTTRLVGWGWGNGRGSICRLTFDGGGCGQRGENYHGGDGGHSRDAAGDRHGWTARCRHAATAVRKRRGPATRRFGGCSRLHRRRDAVESGTSMTIRPVNRPRTCPETNCRQGRPAGRSVATPPPTTGAPPTPRPLPTLPRDGGTDGQ